MREAMSPDLPSVSTVLGFDLAAMDQAVLKVVVPDMFKQVKALMKGEAYHFETDIQKLNEEHDRISPRADETLK